MSIAFSTTFLPSLRNKFHFKQYHDQFICHAFTHSNRSHCKTFNRSLSSSPTNKRIRTTCNATASSPDNSPPTQPKVGAVGVVLVLAALLWSIIICSLMLIAHPFVLLFDRTRRIHQWFVFLWMRDTFRTAFINVRVNGRENIPSTPCLYIANHESILDMFALSFTKSPAKFMIPARALKFPFVGWMMNLARWIGVTGNDRRSQMTALKDITTNLTQGSSVMIFPQGNPSNTAPVAKFASPIFKIARNAGVLVVPLSIEGTGAMFEGNVAPLKWPKKRISVTVHKPIVMDERSDKEIAEITHQAVTSVLPN